MYQIIWISKKNVIYRINKKQNNNKIITIKIISLKLLKKKKLNIYYKFSKKEKKNENKIYKLKIIIRSYIYIIPFQNNLKFCIHILKLTKRKTHN